MRFRMKQKDNTTYVKKTFESGYHPINKSYMRKQSLELPEKVDIFPYIEQDGLEFQFEYQNKVFDAREVFDLPPNYTQSDLKRAYEQALSRVDLHSRGFVQQAYQVLSKPSNNA